MLLILKQLLVPTVIALIPIAVAIAIRVRGPERFIRGIDWSRVPEREAIAQYFSLLLLAIGVLSLLYGPVKLFVRGDALLDQAASIVFGTLFVLLFLARWLIRRRLRLATRSDGQR